MATIFNASPQVVHLGTDDRSTRQVRPEELQAPQHCPKFFLFTKKGPLKPQLVNGPSAQILYGRDSFDPLKPYFTHQTEYANIAFSEANNSVIQRLIPSDAGEPANLRIWVDIIQDGVPNYLRNSDGTIRKDALGAPIVDSTNPVIPGYRIKFYTEYVPTGITSYGSAAPRTGFMTNNYGAPFNPYAPSTGTSTMYPIIELRADTPGAYGNDLGIRLWAPQKEFVDKQFISNKYYPLNVALVTRDNVNRTPENVASIYGIANHTFVFEKNALNPFTKDTIDLEHVLPGKWQNISDTRYDMVYQGLDQSYVYYNYVDTLYQLFISMESSYISSTPISIPGAGLVATLPWYDFTTDNVTDILANEQYLFNILGFKNSNGVEYFTTYYDQTPITTLPSTFTETQPVESTVFWMNGGSDGTLSDAEFEAAVINAMQDYLDPNSKVMDLALNPESIIYDSGFSYNAKKELCNFIALRKDTFVVLSTWDTHNTLPNDLSSILSMARALRTRLELFPESDYFGTPVMRGMVVGQSGISRSSIDKRRMPLSEEILRKSARYMGAANGKWKSGLMFDNAPGNIIDNMYSIEPDFIPAGTKPILWDEGIVWAQPYDRRSYFFPALQTVYYDDTSVLNSYFTAMAIAYINKLAFRTWRDFTGTVGMTDAQFLARVKEHMERQLQGIFDNKFTIIVEAINTSIDEVRGYSWTLVVKIGALNMKTVMTTWVEAYRVSDLVGQ